MLAKSVNEFCPLLKSRAFETSRFSLTDIFFIKVAKKIEKSFSTNIQHITGTQNLVADVLSRIKIDSISKASCLDYKDTAAAQLVDEDFKPLLENNSTSLKFKQQYFPLEDVTPTCDVSTNVSRPFIPKDYHKIIFQHLHGLLHPGIAASTKLATQRFVWPSIRRDI
ncbi:transposon Tf2-6 polyprotein [Trichonephila clavipes]|nr:transposon Tf2-6 polyprotein [Trichonephila clavipes]